ncbi:MAG: radical SAM family heme chaperone HemW [Gammaproteobacteria bacterium]|nr:radical SAM family heme chaperone HemW [Gammaproteobacteria bacterium]MDA7961984.1 radical SAM family heme chaperone HemW [Gammaproteobacteria bacterium]MDA7970703.1 radical SAM family heme chaperone HemW [Gammaproteobacteria bacterium]MDA7995693.1 radical SAM family heme chaperone HemW [Gammaproteobacteria bacterium]CAJ2377511.1 MAG: Heme chaperone HemW [Arenicellales bacterium IbO2]
MPTAPPLALYAHFPWCVKKCPYCDFNSHELRGEIDQAEYVGALLRDLDRDLAPRGAAAGARGRKLISVFLGGGTPSLFAPESIAEFLAGLRARFDCGGAEITMEANPGAAEHENFREFRAAGVNRLSLGAQSFADAQLRALGRIHSGGDARRAIRAALDAGFENLNVDLMFALPQQTTRAALRDLDIALDFSPRHLSLYQLTIEPHTHFYRRPPKLPGDELAVEMQRKLQARAEKCELRRYEVSAFAKSGGACRHNLNYWEFGDYLGIGAGAHGKITRAGKDEHEHVVTRYWKRKHPRRYLAGLEEDIINEGEGENPATENRAEIARADMLFEFLLGALRLRDGFSADLLRARAAHSAEEALAAVAGARARGWVVQKNKRVRCSEKGWWFLDEILQEALPAEPKKSGKKRPDFFREALDKGGDVA